MIKKVVTFEDRNFTKLQKYVKSTRNTTRLPPTLYWVNKTAYNDRDITNLFKQYLRSVLNKPNEKIWKLNQTNISFIESIYFMEVENNWRWFPRNWSSSIGGFSPRLSLVARVSVLVDIDFASDSAFWLIFGWPLLWVMIYLPLPYIDHQCFLVKLPCRWAPINRVHSTLFIFLLNCNGAQLLQFRSVSVSVGFWCHLHLTCLLPSILI